MTTQNPEEPQKLDYESVPTVQTFFEVQGGGRVVQRIVRVIAPIVHFLIRIVAFFVTRIERTRNRPPLTALILFALTACSPGSENRDDASNATFDERPVWKFGEQTVRTDALPAELDSLRTWGEYYDSASPVAYRVDLNQDGNPEWLVRSATSVCGSVGCPTLIFSRRADGRLATVLDNFLVRELYVTSRYESDWPTLWALLGGGDGGLYRLTFVNGQYEITSTLHRNTHTEDLAPGDTFAQLLRRTPSR